MSIIVSTTYPDPRESERCRRSPLPRRSLEPWDVVDDRCDPSVLLETRREPLLKAPAKADSRRSGFGFDPVTGTKLPTTLLAIFSCDASARRSFCARATWAPKTTSLRPKASGAAAKRSPLVSILRSSRSDGKRKGFRSLPLESLTLRSFAIGSFSRRSIAYCASPATLSPFPVESAFQFSRSEVVTRHVGRRVDLAWFRHSK